jgi:glycosyltransferase involved in cell wall biosynthesis
MDVRTLLVLYSEIGVDGGGVGVVTLNQARAFTERGLPIGIVELGPCWKSKRILPGDIPVWTVMAPSVPSYRRPRSWASFARSAWQLRWIIQRFRPDVLHVHFPLGQILPVVGAHMLPHRWRLVVTVHNSEIRVSPFVDPWFRRLQQSLFARADAVTAVSSSMLADTTRLYPCVSDKGHVIHNGVGEMWFQTDHLDSTEEQQNEKYVLFVGRLVPVKGVDLLLRAWKNACLHVPDTTLWVAGDGSELGNLRSLANELGIAPLVRFLGPKKPEELRRLYRNAEAVVLPSRREGLPLTVLEAGACGAPCVTTSIPGIAEIIEDGVTGFLVEPESTDALTSGILKALRLSREERRHMRLAAQRRIGTYFSEEQLMSGYMRLFQSLLTRHGARPQGPSGCSMKAAA